MKIRQNPSVSNKENYQSSGKQISSKSLLLSAQNSKKVLMQYKKKTSPDHKSINKDNKQNIPIPKSTDNQNIKTIENKIRGLLKGKQELVSYLESEKQFLSILDNHDPNLKDLINQRGKLTSSLTEKKKSRIDTHYGTKTLLNSQSKKVNGYITQNNKRSNTKIKNTSVTVELVNSSQKLQNESQSCKIQNKHYETISFDKVNSDLNEKTIQKMIKNNLTEQNQQPPKYCLILTSPKRNIKQKNSKNHKNSLNNQTSDYEQPNFSPWALPKDLKHSDFDMIEMDSYKSSRKGSYNFDSGKQLNEQIEIQRFEQNNRLKTQKNSQKQTAKNKIRKNDQSKQQSSKNEKESLSHDQTQKKIQKKYQQTKDCDALSKEDFDKKVTLSDLIKKEDIQKKCQSQKVSATKPQRQQFEVKIMKSSQVVIFNGQPSKVSEMFAPKASMKHYLHPKRSFKKNLSNKINYQRVFHTEVEEESFSGPKIADQLNNNYLKQESELIELKKTQEFLKEIIISKSNVSYLNNNNQQPKSKKQFKKSNMITNQKSENKVKSLSAKQSAEMRFKTYNHLKSERTFLDTTINLARQKNTKNAPIKDCKKNNEQGNKQNQCQLHDQVFYKKARTSLDKPLHQNEIYQMISSSNTKYLTEANLNGFYMVNDSKIRNQRSAYARKKRHSTMLTKNRKNCQSMQTQIEEGKRRYSYSVQKQVISKMNVSLSHQDKGFGIINPITKQLYRKYVSLVQKKN